jgi:16S rRNA (cytidine1402-2'-O)-methyltransferase
MSVTMQKGYHPMSTLQPSTLYVVGTPIGNLEDMTFRAVRVLGQVDVIAAEDTRHSGKLLKHFQIATPQLSYHEHNRQQRLPELLNRLQRGQAIALITDAGMPGISDPGYDLVRDVLAAGFSVIPIPGVSAVVTALCAAGLNTERFSFEGFPPVKAKARKSWLGDLQSETRTMVFYESPHRLRNTLADFHEVFGGDRPLVLARELTKIHEEFWRGTLTEAAHRYQDCMPQGEFTIVLEGAIPFVEMASEADLRQELLTLLAQGLSRSVASRQLAQRRGISKRQIYQLALDLPNNAASDA